MRPDHTVRLERATPASAPLLSNLLELYSHELSDIFQLELGPDGRYGYARLPLYWSEPESRYAFLIRDGARVAGFALVTRGSPMTDDAAAFDVAEFFVLRRYRRCGIGRQAARALWDSLPGRWVVRVAEENREGLQFWSASVRLYAEGAVVETSRSDGRRTWRVFAFTSRAVKADI